MLERKKRLTQTIKNLPQNDHHDLDNQNSVNVNNNLNSNSSNTNLNLNSSSNTNSNSGPPLLLSPSHNSHSNSPSFVKSQLTRNWATIGFFDAHPTFETIRPLESLSISESEQPKVPTKSPRRYVRLSSLDDEVDTPVIEVGDVFEQIRRKNLKNGARLLYKVIEVFSHSKSVLVQSVYGKEKKTWKELLDATEYQLVLSDKSYLSKRTFHPQQSLRDPLLRDKAKYSGAEGRDSLFLLFRQAPDDFIASSTSNDPLSSPRPITPRLTYVMECRKQQIPPIPLLTRCYHESYPVLNLSNQLIGERFTVAIAQSLPNMTFLKEIDLTNNRLDSNSIPVLLYSISQSTVESIILDKNKIGKTGVSALHCLMSGFWNEFKDKKVRNSRSSVVTSPISPRSTSPISNSSSPISSTSSQSRYNSFSPVKSSFDIDDSASHYSNDMSSISSNYSAHQSISSSSISTFASYSPHSSNSILSQQILSEPLPPHSLVKLSINSNSLGDNTVSKLIKSIQTHCKNLQYLSLNNNSCSTFTVTSLTSLFREGIVPLEYLDLSWNNLGTENATILLNCLARHFMLKKLLLDYNGINSNILSSLIMLGGMKSISENNSKVMLLKDATLLNLIRSYNGVVQLPLNQTIEVISLANNSIPTETLQFLELNNLTELKFLSQG